MFTVELKELILLYITVNGFISYIPQIVKILKRRTSEGISISSWVLWTLNSSLYFLYLLLDGVGIWLILSQALEVFLIATTLLLVIIYRKIKK